LVNRYVASVSKNAYNELAAMRNALGMDNMNQFDMPMGSTGRAEFSNAQGDYATANLRTPIGGFVRYPMNIGMMLGQLRSIIVNNCFNKHGILIAPSSIQFTTKSATKGVTTIGFNVAPFALPITPAYKSMFSSIDPFDCSSDNMPFQVVIYMGTPVMVRQNSPLFRGAIGPVRQGGTVRNPNSPLPSSAKKGGLGGIVPSVEGLNKCKRCARQGCDCVRDEKGRERCSCEEINLWNTKLANWCKRHPELC
jgi:hypothetical protein